MKKIKILRIIARLNIGGPAIHTVLLTGGLDKDRFDSRLVVGRVDDSEEDMLYLAHEKKLTPLIVTELGRKINLKNDLIALWKLYHLIKKEKPDIVHTHTAKAGALGRLACLLYNLTKIKNRVKLVHTFHGHVLEGYFSKIKTILFIWIERILAKFTDKIIVVSQKIKEDLLSLGIGSQEKIVIIPLGLELEDLLNIAPTYNKNSQPRIGIIGRLVPIKNHRMFLEVAKEIQDNIKIKAKFFIIGDGELRNELREYAKELGIEEEVIFTGWQRNLETIYQDLDIVALTSLNEGTPVSLIEAMAAEKPVIATDVGGVRDLLGDNERGILVNSQDINGFSQGLKRLLDDATLRNKIGKLGRDFVKDKFTKERLINDIDKLYNNILQKEPNLCAR